MALGGTQVRIIDRCCDRVMVWEATTDLDQLLNLYESSSWYELLLVLFQIILVFPQGLVFLVEFPFESSVSIIFKLEK